MTLSVNHLIATSGAGNGISTGTFTPTPGARIILFIGAKRNTTLPTAFATPTDSLGGSWSLWQASNYDPSADPRQRMEIWARSSLSPQGPMTVSVSTTSADFVMVSLEEVVSSLGTTPANSAIALSTNANGDPAPALAAVPNSTDTVTVSCFMGHGAVTVTAPANNTELTQFAMAGGANGQVQTVYDLVPAAQTCTWSTTNTYSIGMTIDAREVTFGYDSLDAGSLTGWTSRWVTSGVTYTESGGFLDINVSTQGRHLITMDAAGSSIADVEVLAKIRGSVQTTSNPGPAIFVRGSGAAAAENGYRFALSMNATPAGVLQCAKYVAGVSTVIGTEVLFPWTTNTWYWLRARVNGSTINAKVWADGSAESTATALTQFTDTAVAGAGWLGVFGFLVGTVDCDYFSYATSNGLALGPDNATATTSLTMGQTATGTVASAARSATASIPLTMGQTATATVTTAGQISATASVPLTMGQTATATLLAQATASIPLTMGQSATGTTGGTITVGGIAIGSAGSGFYAGYTLAWGDEFTDTDPNIVGPQAPAGRYPSTRAPFSHSGSRGGQTIVHYYSDPLHTGFLDANRGVSLGNDAMSMTAGTRIVLKTKLLTTAEKAATNRTAVLTGARTLAVTVIQTGLAALFYPGTDEVLVEAKIRHTAKAGNPAGWHPAMWSYMAAPMHFPIGLEHDITEGNSQNSYTNQVPWLDGAAVGGSTVAGPNNTFDGTDHVYTAKLSKSVATYYIDTSQTGTVAADANTSNEPSQIILTSVSFTPVFSFQGEFFSQAAWDADPDGAAMEVDWIRFWRKSTGVQWKPLVAVADLNVAYNGTGSVVLPAATTLWGSTPTTEYVQCHSLEANDPGDTERSMFIQFPTGVSYNSGTRTLSVDWSSYGRWPGRLIVTVTPWTAAGGVMEPLRFCINRGPRVRTNKQVLPTGVAYARDIYQECDVGNLTPKTITVSGLPTGLTHDGVGNITGTPTTPGTYSVTIQVTNNVGQSVSKAVPFVVANGAGMWDFVTDKYVQGGSTYSGIAALISASKASFSRARDAYYIDDQGAIFQVTSGSLRRGSKGALLEPARSSFVMGSRTTNTASADTFNTGMAATQNVGNNTIDDPAGGTSAEKQVSNTSSSTHQIGQNPYSSFLPGAIGTVIELGWIVRADTARYIQLSPASNVLSTLGYMNVDLRTGQITQTGGSGLISTKVETLTGGWVWIACTFAVTANALFGVTLNHILTGTDSRLPTFTGTGKAFQTFEVMGAVASDGKITTPVYNTTTGATSATTRPADQLSAVLGASSYTGTLVFDDGSTQSLGTITGTYTINAATINRPNVTALLLEPLTTSISATASTPLTMGISATATNLGAGRSATATVPLRMGMAATVKTTATTTTIQGEVSTLHAQAIIEMFEYDDTNIGGSQVVRWHAGTNVMRNAITWQGLIYTPMPIEVTGFSMSASGSLPRPQLKASNIGGALGAYLRSMDGAVGAKITRRRTLARYMDAVNFPSGNPNADSTAHFPDEIYFLARKTSETPIFIEYELAASFDVAGVQIPRRQVIASTCEWVYRSAECGYAGPPVQDINGVPTTNPSLDRCRKTLDACKARFGQHGVLNSSAFPASLLVQL